MDTYIFFLVMKRNAYDIEYRTLRKKYTTNPILT